MPESPTPPPELRTTPSLPPFPPLASRLGAQEAVDYSLEGQRDVSVFPPGTSVGSTVQTEQGDRNLEATSPPPSLSSNPCGCSDLPFGTGIEDCALTMTKGSKLS